MPRTRLIAVLLLGLLLIGGIVVIYGLSATRDGGSASSGSPASSAQALGSAATGLPSPSRSPSTAGPETTEEQLAILETIEGQVEEIRGLPPAEIGPAEIITRAQLGEELRRIFDEEYPLEERERDNLALRALGLLDADEDVAELQLQLLGQDVLGFYDDRDKRMVVVSDAGLDPLAKITYAHEYTHALQDAAFGLDSLDIDVEGDDDGSLARTALQEGDANTTMLAWAFAHLSQAEIAGLEQPAPSTVDIPSWMSNQLAFPYTFGQYWASQVAGGNPLAPDFSEIDAAFADPPESTEQIIDIAKWRADEAPLPVEVPDLAAKLGEGWQAVDETPIGQATISIMLEYFGIGVREAGLAAEGWGGDRVAIATGPDDAFAVLWRLEWDAPDEAAEFAAAYEGVVEKLPFEASVRELSDGAVLVIHASTAAIHDAALGVAGE